MILGRILSTIITFIISFGLFYWLDVQSLYFIVGGFLLGTIIVILDANRKPHLIDKENQKPLAVAILGISALAGILYFIMPSHIRVILAIALAAYFSALTYYIWINRKKLRMIDLLMIAIAIAGIALYAAIKYCSQH